MISVTHPPYLQRYLNEHSQQQPDYDPRAIPRTPRSVRHQSLNSTNQPFEALGSGALPNAPMNAETWGNMAQFNTDKMGRLPHQRESSLSSMGSTGPASPYNHNTSNPQIAITDSTGDELSDMHAQDASNQNGPMFPMHKAIGNPYSGYHNLDNAIPEMAYPVAIHGPSSKSHIDRGLLPAPELAGSNRSYPTSVASSIAGGDSPATPTVSAESDTTDNKRRKGMKIFRTTHISDDLPFPRLEGYGNIPKLDRTMTDVYGDELYSPNFTITSTPPSQPQQLTTLSPPNDIFSQRLNAANSQHLNVGQSPATAIARGKSSPFRSSSPFAKPSNQNFAAPPQARPVSEAHSSVPQGPQGGQMFSQRVAPGAQPETPKTISPKDAILEFNDTEGDADFPLFPQQPPNLDMDLSKMMSTQANPPQFIAGGNGLMGDQFNYMSSHIPPSIQVPQQYPFVGRMHPSSNGSPPRLSSSGSSSDSGGATPLARPAGTAADGGTYTCTYHGCALRFETPTLLQKHKREGHRQTHGLTPARPDLGMGATGMGMTSNLLNSQAGPHRCDRINPSTGKSCATVFSRPYDLTRHEDTIHNARKQKVRCDICTEEKTFSRADALTRHYRVCHPDMELPGKHRRRGGG